MVKKHVSDFEKTLSSTIDDFFDSLDQEEIDFEELEKLNESDDLLDLAYQKDKETAVKLAKKALKLNPNNLDAEFLIADLSCKTFINYLKKLESIIKHGEEILENVYHLTDEDKGHYWGLWETRPYMRVRFHYVEALISAKMYRKAAEQLEELLELSKTDNLGARYKLIAIYTMLEEKEKAENLLKKYKEESIHMLLPITFLYFKLGNFTKAKNFIKKMEKNNDYTLKFFQSLRDGNIMEESDIHSYQVNSPSEYISATFELPELFFFSDSFASFVLENLSNQGIK